MKTRSFRLILMLIVVCSLSAREQETVLTETMSIFGDDKAPPILLDSSHGWTVIAVINWQSIDHHMVVKKSPRFWRLRSRYEHQRTTGPVTVQIRIRNQTGTSVFTHPWAQNAQRTAESYSNWFEDPKRLMNSGIRSIVETKLIAPPRSTLKGTLYSVTMEAWDTVPDVKQPHQKTPSVQLAYPLPLAINLMSPETLPYGNGPKAALDFALEFIDSCLTGELAAYYRLQNDTIFSLSAGSFHQKYHIPPPAQIPDIATIDEYERRFDYKIYDIAFYEKMFPEWFEASREWKPGKKTYLFMGHIDRMEKVDIDVVNYLIFFVERHTDGEWNVVARM